MNLGAIPSAAIVLGDSGPKKVIEGEEVLNFETQ